MLWTIIFLCSLAFLATSYAILSANRRGAAWSFCPHCEQYHSSDGDEQTHRPEVPYGAIGKALCPSCAEHWDGVGRAVKKERAA